MPRTFQRFESKLETTGVCSEAANRVSVAKGFERTFAGVMSAGIAQENGPDSAQNVTFSVAPGEVFIAPQGLLHYNHNQECSGLAFLQFFNSNDAAAVNIINALAALGKVPYGDAAIRASTADSIKASEFMAFALDPVCLETCHFPATGAPGDGFDGVPKEIKALFGR